jgi:hypothetical protein
VCPHPSALGDERHPYTLVPDGKVESTEINITVIFNECGVPLANTGCLLESKQLGLQAIPISQVSLMMGVSSHGQIIEPVQ